MDIIKQETKALLDEQLDNAKEIAIAIAQAREAGIDLGSLEDTLKSGVARLLRMRQAFFGDVR